MVDDFSGPISWFRTGRGGISMIFDVDSGRINGFVGRFQFRCSARHLLVHFHNVECDYRFLHRTVNSWSIPIIRYEVLALKSCYLTVPKWISMKIRKLNISLGHAESDPLLGLELLVGPRWREFHCLAASRCCVSLFSLFFYLHGAKHSLSGRRLGNPRGLAEKWARDPFEAR